MKKRPTAPQHRAQQAKNTSLSLRLHLHLHNLLQQALNNNIQAASDLQRLIHYAPQQTRDSLLQELNQ